MFKLFGEKDIKPLNGEILISPYIPKFLHFLIKDIPDDFYFLGPMYIEGGYQIFASGWVKDKETETQAFKREMLEEFRLNPFKYICKKYGTGTYYIVNIEDTEFYTEKLYTSKEEDSRFRKVFFCVIGTKEKIVEYLEKINSVHECDNIIGIWSCDIKKAKKIIAEYTEEGRIYPKKNSEIYETF